MGEVYRATDTNLKRAVAIKVLPDALGSDDERLARFRREAEVLASLNHSNIAAIYGLERSDNRTALVMELVEGPTLEERLRRGAIPIEEALGIAKQIAEALEAAHERGIVHRDLKPANVKVRADGAVKVLDFGIAKVMEPAAGSSPDVSMSPTITTPAMTRAGMILGTAAYMAPEQARGNIVDRRADIWAFGCVLYEMLTGRRGFDGATTMEVLSNVLKTEPNWSALPPETPPNVRWLLRRCLHKERDRRIRDIGDARLLIDDVLAQPEGEASHGHLTPASPLRHRLLWPAVVIIAATGAAAVGWTWRMSNGVAAEIRLDVTAPPTDEPTSLAISPDGQTVAFAGISDGQSRLWLRSLDGVTARALPGTENATSPFWSPDGRSIGFAADNQLKRVELETGSVRVIVDNAFSGAWNQDGTILYHRVPGGGLFRVSADGGVPQAESRASPRVNDQSFPRFLPDYRQFLFYASGTAPGIYVGALGGADEPRRILDAQSATYIPSGHLLFVPEVPLCAALRSSTSRARREPDANRGTDHRQRRQGRCVGVGGWRNRVSSGTLDRGAQIRLVRPVGCGARHVGSRLRFLIQVHPSLLLATTWQHRPTPRGPATFGCWTSNEACPAGSRSTRPLTRARCGLPTVVGLRSPRTAVARLNGRCS